MSDLPKAEPIPQTLARLEAQIAAIEGRARCSEQREAGFDLRLNAIASQVQALADKPVTVGQEATRANPQ